ncbi:MAG: universal stress protein [Pyrinomonadaceae bacterium]
MIRSILFPTDFSAVANSALPLAVKLAEEFEAIIHAAHIASGSDPHITETTRYEFPRPLAGTGEVQMQEEIIPQSADDPVEVLIRTAQRNECDLIVMASHGRSDIAQFFLGRSVAERVARDSQIPTIIARLYGARRTTRPIDRMERIIYATDLAEETRKILPVAAEIARRTGAQLSTVCVFAEGDEQPLDGGRDVLKRFFEEAEASDLFNNFQTLRGGVGESLVEYAAGTEADLIAITSSICCGGNPRLTETAEFIIRNAPCPVLCVRT